MTERNGPDQNVPMQDGTDPVPGAPHRRRVHDGWLPGSAAVAGRLAAGSWRRRGDGEPGGAAGATGS